MTILNLYFNAVMFIIGLGRGVSSMRLLRNAVVLKLSLSSSGTFHCPTPVTNCLPLVDWTIFVVNVVHQPIRPGMTHRTKVPGSRREERERKCGGCLSIGRISVRSSIENSGSMVSAVSEVTANGAGANHGDILWAHSRICDKSKFRGLLFKRFGTIVHFIIKAHRWRFAM